MKTNKSNRLLALFLCLMMLLGTVPLSGIAFAAAPCPNHTAHDAACGYIEAVEGHACGHTHDEACGYSEGKEGVPCKHEQGEHDESCGYMEGAEEIPCDKGCSEADGDGAIVHAEGCAYTPAVEGAACSHEKHDGSCGYAEAVAGAACRHEHDTACGYVEAVEGHACGHTCELCNGAEKVMLLGEAREATCSISGTVTQVDYITAIPGITVTLWQNSGQISSTTTDQEGKYAFTSLAPGEYEVRAGGQASDGSYYAEDNWYVTISDRDATNGNLYPEPGNAPNTYSISGRVIQTNSNTGLYRLKVTLWVGDKMIDSVSTNRNGDYSFNSLEPGDYTVKAGGKTSSANPIDYIEQSKTVTVISENQTCSFELQPSDPDLRVYSITGSVSKVNGEGPLPALKVTLWRDGEQIDEVETKRSGDYTFYSVKPGLYLVKAGGLDKRGIYYAMESRPVIITDKNKEDFSFDLEPGAAPNTYTISGHVALYNCPSRPGMPVKLWTEGIDQPIQSATTNDVGAFTFTSVAAGEYTVKAGGLIDGILYTEDSEAVTISNQNATGVVLFLKASPSAPQNFTASPGNNQVALSWTAPQSSGSEAITKYEVSKDGGASWVTATSNTGHTFTNLTNGQSYTFKVRAVNGVGAGAAATATATPTVPGPSAPQNFNTTYANTILNLSWKAPASDGGSPIVKYQYSVTKGGEPDNWQDIPGSNASTTSYTVTGLTNLTNYTVKLRAVNSTSIGEAVSDTFYLEPSSPGAVRNLTAIPGDGQMTLNWEKPENDGGSPITHYQYRYNADPNSSGAANQWSRIPDSGPDTVSFTVTGLENGVELAFFVRAYSAYGMGAHAMVMATPQAASTVPTAPQNFKATPGDRQVALSWEVPASNGGAEITGYEVSKDNGTSWVDATSATGHTFDNLTNGQSYTFQVRAVNSAGKGTAASKTATPQAAATVPTAPRNFTATPGDRQVVLSWEAPASNGGATITKYEVSSNGGTNWADATSATGHTFENLTNGQSYTFQVRAVNSAGKGAAATATATPQAAPTVPGAPRNFTATPGDRQVALSWEAPQSNGGATITKYEVSSNGGTTWTDATSATGHTFANLTNGQSYTFQVRAVNSAGKGAAATATATPQAAPTVPGAPRNFTATPGDRQVALSWEAPASNGGATITKYEVSSNGGTNWTDATSATGHTFDNLTNGQSYTFQVRAVNSAGKGTAATATATPQAAPTVPGAPRNFTATPSDRQVVLSWEAPASNGGAAITKYEVSSNGGTNWTDATGSTGHTFTNLTNGQSYTFKVRAVNSAGKGTAASKTATPQAAATVPTAPRNFTATPGDRQVALSWEAPASNGGATITKYEVSSNGGTTWTDATSATGHTFTGLTNGQSYTFQVRAVNSAGKGTAATEAATPQAAAPNLTGITTPDAITGVANGTLLSNIRLPDHVAITTTQGGKQATVIWNRGQQTPTYDPTSKAAQTFTVSGTVTLPVSVTNTGNIPLSVQISVTVAAEDADAITGVQIVNKPGKLSYTEGDALDLSGLTVKLNFSKSGEKTVGLSEFAANHITVSPANGAKLSRGDTTVTVSAGGKSDSFPITVNAMQRVQTPAFSPAGGTYSSARDVKITCGTAGANIYYTTNGDTPTAASSRYTGNIRVSSTTTIQAVAIKDGMEDSAVASATFTIRRPPDDDDSPSGGGGGSSYTPPETQNTYTAVGDKITQSVSRSDLRQLENNGKSLTIQNGTANMTFEPAALKAILAAIPSTARNITFSSAPADLSAFPEAAKLIGNRPVYAFTISYQDSRGKTVAAKADFPAGAVSIALDYTPAAGESAGSLFMVYVDDKGAVTWLDKSSYADGKMLAEVSHFSVYGVAYKAPAPVFADIAGHWAKVDIEFVAARGLLSGTGNGQFSPNGTMTRGMFVTALGRLAGVNPQSYKTRSFTDVKADAYYAAYVEWAAKNNIVKGTGDKLFSPDAPVTREQMAVMMTNYAGQMGYSIPAPLAAVTFTDNNKIGAWAVKEVAAMQRAGIIKGKDGGRFDPQASATRAEVSAVLRRFVEIVIDPATAQGWVKNDSGQWLYYKDGKTLTGWQKIGGNWYYFYSTGAMAVNTKIDGYVIGPDGKRKEED